MKVPLFPVSVGASDFSCYWPFSGISYDIILCTYNNLCSCGVFNGGCPRGQFSAFCLFLRNIFLYIIVNRRRRVRRICISVKPHSHSTHVHARLRACTCVLRACSITTIGWCFCVWNAEFTNSDYCIVCWTTVNQMVFWHGPFVS